MAMVQRTATLAPPRRLSKLLGLRLGFFRNHDMMDTIAVDEVMRGTPAVKVVNLWATWCPPCVRENQRFLELSKGWRREVRFVPIHVGAIGNLEKYRALVDEMPAAAVSPLIDGSGDAVLNLLRADGLLETDEGIPITLVLDCRNDLRWMHVGELVDKAAIDAEITRLRAELGSGQVCGRAGPPARLRRRARAPSRPKIAATAPKIAAVRRPARSAARRPAAKFPTARSLTRHSTRAHDVCSTVRVCRPRAARVLGRGAGACLRGHV
jgi:thiol-disulfide isomerase/thioredoxin